MTGQAPAVPGRKRPAGVATTDVTLSAHIGTNAEYVFKLQSALADCGMHDPYIDELAGELTRISGQPA